MNKNLIVRDWVAEFESYGTEMSWSKSLLMHILKRKKKVIYSMYRDYLKMEEMEVIEYIGRIF